MCRHLLVNPKERRVVIVESILSSTTNFRNTLAKVLFQHFEVSFSPSCASHTIDINSNVGFLFVASYALRIIYVKCISVVV